MTGVAVGVRKAGGGGESLHDHVNGYASGEWSLQPVPLVDRPPRRRHDVKPSKLVCVHVQRPGSIRPSDEGAGVSDWYRANTKQLALLRNILG